MSRKNILYSYSQHLNLVQRFGTSEIDLHCRVVFIIDRSKTVVLVLNAHKTKVCFIALLNITKTCLCNVDPLKPLFYIVKLVFTRVNIIFLISAQKRRLWVLVRTTLSRRF